MFLDSSLETAGPALRSSGGRWLRITAGLVCGAIFVTLFMHSIYNGLANLMTGNDYRNNLYGHDGDDSINGTGGNPPAAGR